MDFPEIGFVVGVVNARLWRRYARKGAANHHCSAFLGALEFWRVNNTNFYNNVLKQSHQLEASLWRVSAFVVTAKRIRVSIIDMYYVFEFLLGLSTAFYDFLIHQATFVEIFFD